MSAAVRPPAVAGLFYPADADELAETVDRLLAAARPQAPEPVALVAPHAGYVYSGPIAASAFALLDRTQTAFDRVVLLGPSHFVALEGMALSSAGAFGTPLGEVPIDRQACEALSELPRVRTLDRAHAREHALEVELPFLQRLSSGFHLVPLVCGVVEPADVAGAIDRVWRPDGTLVVCSSDLSHYHDYDTALGLDRETCRAVEQLRVGAVSAERACGCHALNGLLAWARRHSLRVTTLDLRNSGDTAGPRDRVVGYGAWALGRGGLDGE